MVFDNLHVKHKTFGDGIVVERNGKYITVKFENTQKIFVYPDIFEKFLTLADGTVCDEIFSDIQKVKDEKQQIINKINEENRRAREHGIVIPGKENQALESEDDENGSYKSKSENEENV